MIVVDASVWVSYLAPQDPFHRASTEWIDRYSEQSGAFLAPMLLLAEVAGAMARRYASPSIGQHAQERIRTLPELELVPLDSVVGIRAAAVVSVFTPATAPLPR